MYTLYGKAGWGSVIVEAQLDLSGLPYRIDEVDPLESAADRERLAKFNPLAQLPTLILPGGQVMTESAAITLHIGDHAPAAGLVPPAGDGARDAFLRWLVFIVANIYPMFTVGDDTSRFVADPAAQKELRVSTENYKSRSWQIVESAIAPRPWFLGSRFSALDIYAAADNSLAAAAGLVQGELPEAPRRGPGRRCRTASGEGMAAQLPLRLPPACAAQGLR